MIYRCDPMKHKYCKKSKMECQRKCFHTTFKEFSRDGIAREWKTDEDGDVVDEPVES